MKELLQYRKDLLCGEKIRLRGTIAEDELLFAKWWNEETLLFGNRSRIFPTYEKDNIDLFHTWSTNQDRTGFGMTIENLQGDVVGHVTAFHLTMPELIATIGIFIGTEFQGNGYGTEAMQKAVKICFEELNAHKVEVNVHSYNPAAIAVYEKAGFMHEGRRRAATYHQGKYYDVLTMGILREEYFQSL